mmetsp:Transcript_56736/g.128604  ORF Transcript_56736/g.128604 Transcript_56736/m.128604 type:complete len:382 (-) Transcript_56736:192-1337(-)
MATRAKGRVGCVSTSSGTGAERVPPPTSATAGRAAAPACWKRRGAPAGSSERPRACAFRRRIASPPGAFEEGPASPAASPAASPCPGGVWAASRSSATAPEAADSHRRSAGAKGSRVGSLLRGACASANTSATPVLPLAPPGQELPCAAFFSTAALSRTPHAQPLRRLSSKPPPRAQAATARTPAPARSLEGVAATGRAPPSPQTATRLAASKGATPRVAGGGGGARGSKPARRAGVVAWARQGGARRAAKAAPSSRPQSHTVTLPSSDPATKSQAEPLEGAEPRGAGGEQAGKEWGGAALSGAGATPLLSVSPRPGSVAVSSAGLSAAPTGAASLPSGPRGDGPALGPNRAAGRASGAAEGAAEGAVEGAAEGAAEGNAR